jgi:hypothetical protein
MALRLEKPNEPKVATALLQATELDGVRELSAGHAAGMAHAEWWVSSVATGTACTTDARVDRCSADAAASLVHPVMFIS